MNIPTKDDFKRGVSKHFSFLVKEYGFVLKNELYTDHGDKIDFESDVCRVSFIMERCQLLIDLAPSGSVGQEIDLGHIVLQANPESDFKYAFSPDGFVPSEYTRLAFILKKYCEPILRGDFSKWPQIIKFREEWARKKFGSEPNA